MYPQSFTEIGVQLSEDLVLVSLFGQTGDAGHGRDAVHIGQDIRVCFHLFHDVGACRGDDEPVFVYALLQFPEFVPALWDCHCGNDDYCPYTDVPRHL